MKTSAVLIATGGESNFYRSVQEVPEPLRTRLLETTNSANSGTIVIADRAGKEQLSQAMLRRTAGRESLEDPSDCPPKTERKSWLVWMAVGLVLTIGAVLSVLFHVRW